MPRSRTSSEIRGDALALPVAVARRLRTLRTLKFLRHRLGAGRGACRRASASASARCAAGVSGLRAGVEVSEGSSLIAKVPFSTFHALAALAQPSINTLCCAGENARGNSYIWHIRMADIERSHGVHRTLAELAPFRVTFQHASTTIRTSLRSARSRGAADRGGHSRRRAAQASHARRSARRRRRPSRTEDRWPTATAR